MIYLDANASEPLRPAADCAVSEPLRVTCNPASVQSAGRAARARLEASRRAIAQRLGGRPGDLVFTSGGTEADNLAIAALGAGRRILRSAVEHDAVRAASPDAMVLPVDENGIIRLDALQAALADGVPSLVCLMLANNETGVLEPVAETARLCRQAGALLHVDAAQAAGRVAVDVVALGAHSLAISGHKTGGPAGAGALLLNGVEIAEAQIRGGGQELGRRGGTPALAAIAGLAAALETPDPGYTQRLAGLRDGIARAAEAVGARICSGGAARLPNTLCLALAGVRSDLQVIMLDQDGFAVSAGAACSSGKIASSHVLQAMGLGALAGQAIRVSLPWNATAHEADAFATAYGAMAGRARG